MKHISRPVIPDFKTKQELFVYLKANAEKLIAEKKAFPIKSDNFEFGYDIKESVTPGIVKKAQGAAEEPELGKGELSVDVFGNVDRLS